MNPSHRMPRPVPVQLETPSAPPGRPPGSATRVLHPEIKHKKPGTSCAEIPGTSCAEIAVSQAVLDFGGCETRERGAIMSGRSGGRRRWWCSA
mmetsp:Transcript_119752/g.178907  ORF Transcript_119752/g.178907 Transcript_119752/m.178907 type:complete len:93 (-) Transcript_119752:85-363(-)